MHLSSILRGGTEISASRRLVIAQRGAWICWGVFLVTCLVILIARHLFLTHINEYNKDITNLIGQALKAEVSIGRIDPDWDRIWPRLRLVDVRIRKQEPSRQLHTALALPQVDTSLSWRSLFGTPVFRFLRVENAALSIRRTQDDNFEIASFPVKLPDGSGDSDAENPFLTWIVHQGRIDLINTTLTYDDIRPEQTHHEEIHNLNLSLQNGIKELRLGVQAHLHDKDLDFRLGINKGIHEVTDWRKWAGRFYLRSEELNIRDILRHTSFGHLVDEGLGGVMLWADFSDANIVNLTADVALKRLQMRFSPKLRSFKASDLSARLKLRHEGSSLKLEAENLRCVLDEKATIGPVNIRSDLELNAAGNDTLSGKTHANIIHMAFANQLGGIFPDVTELDEFVRKRDIEGILHNATYSWKGPALRPKDWKLETEFENLGLIPTALAGQSLSESFGYAKATGSLEYAPTNGKLHLKQLQTLIIPGVFPKPFLELLQAEGVLSWERQGDRLTSLSLDKLHVKNADVDLFAQGKWIADSTPLGTIDMMANVNHLAANRAFAYLPISMDSDAREWVEKGILGGVAEQGTIVVKGALDRFPWVDSKDQGLFEAKAKLRDASIDYVPEARTNPNRLGDAWPTLTNIQGSLKFVGRSMTIVADSAKSAGLNVSNTTAVIEDFEAPGGSLLQIQGNAFGSLSDMVRYLDISPVGKMLSDAFLNSEADGPAKLDLKLKIPLSNTDLTQVHGDLHLSENTLKMSWPVPELRDITGVISFNERGLEARQIHAQAFAGETILNVTTDEQNRIGINASGYFRPEDIRYFQDSAVVKSILEQFSGDSPFLANIDIDPSRGVTVVAETKLAGIASKLPSPLTKSAKTNWPTRFSWAPARHKKQVGNTLKLSIANKAQLSMWFPREASSIKPRGAIAIGCAPRVPQSGLCLDLKLQKASVETWIPVIDSLNAAAQADSKKSQTSSMPLNQIHANISEVIWGGHRFPSLELKTSLEGKERWKSTLKSPLVDGDLTWDFRVSEMGQIHANFRKLHVPTKIKDPLQAALEHGRKHSMPDIEGTVADLAIGEISLGSLQLKGTASKQDNRSVWTVDECVITNPDAQLSAQGLWNADNETHLKASLDLTDGGKLLERLSIPGLIEKTHGRISTDLRWAGAPWSPQLETFDGSATIDLHRGIFQKVDTGVGGTVLSLVSTQSLFKRLTLDFFDLTNSAYTFDTWDGKLVATSGLVTTDNMKVAGPKASILFSGLGNLSHQTIDAKAIVIPNVNLGAASLALTFVNPFLGIGTFVTQLLLSDPINRMMATEYTISGPWSNPEIRTTSPENKSKAQ